MDLTLKIFAIFLLILAAAYFAISEISLAGSRRVRLTQMAEAGDSRAQEVLNLQERPGPFFSVIQIGINAVAILGGIVGEPAFKGIFNTLLEPILPQQYLDTTSFVCSFVVVTILFIIFADLIPKRIGMSKPEEISVRLIGSMQVLIRLLKPFVWVLTIISNSIMKMLGLPTQNKTRLTSEDIVATVDAGAAAGLIAPTEQAAIENVMDLESRLVPSAMTAREYVVYFTLDESYESITKKIAESPHNKFPVCDRDIDHVIGYVDAKDLLRRVIEGKTFSLKDQNCISSIPAVPDSLTLSEVLELFKNQRSDFAVVLNEYALTVGVITLNDIMSTVMGEFVLTPDEAQIVQRDDGSWLIDGATPIDDLERVFDFGPLPEDETYETVAGFMMYMLRKIPKLTDRFVYEGYRFEVIDVERHRIDQILVTKVDDKKEQTSASEDSEQEEQK
ncbi:hemolysin family protein [uncultured Parasutterella sp.]|uniref:hemolysin family protein n=1 Tax=uncultured Parasutterella sp. TaxID=1263098 RepID=UPI00272B916C|nr:hemolysin family protein [uncultured Parasutterella sp.]